MSTDDDGDAGKTETTFTRAQMAKMVNAQVREKLAEALAEYGDLDELRNKAAEHDKSKGKIDQVLEKLTAAETRASSAEAANLRRDVADELGLSARQARRLTGKTRDELLADGREMIEDMGIKPKSGSAEIGKTGEVEEGSEEAEEEAEEESTVRRPPPVRTRRPQENLRPGAPRTDSKPEETDPLKLAALIPRR
jgi:hypothetical protein